MTKHTQSMDLNLFHHKSTISSSKKSLKKLFPVSFESEQGILGVQAKLNVEQSDGKL